ncbi:MAG TPA: flagellar motor protein MotA, partial [Solibacterales bacterium]|nr:flagellar motor protein MotA [Bryobacterales bacterium]
MLLQLQVWALMLLQEAAPAVSFDPRHIWATMTPVGKGVVIVLFIMSAWS